MSQPKISVIIPVYNVSGYLDKCLWSVTNQTFHDIEIIVVNDGSTDNSLSIIEQYAATDNRIKVINKDNEGLAFARKTGLEHAKGEYIHHLDGDDFLETNCYEMLYPRASETGADMMIMKFWFDNPDTNELIESKNYYKSEMNNIDFLNNLFSTTTYYCVWQYIHKRTLYDNGILFDKKLLVGEDAYLTTQLAYYSKKIEFVDVPLHHYVNRNTSVTNATKPAKVFNDLILYIEMIIDFISQKPEYSLMDKSLSMLIARTECGLMWEKYFNITHIRAKRVVAILKKYPEIELEVYPLRKLIRLYAINGILGRIYAQYYILKGKIK